jgi:hypothetical protein
MRRSAASSSSVMKYFLSTGLMSALQTNPIASIARLLGVMRSREFKADLARLQGLDVAQCGSIEEIGAASPRSIPGRCARGARRAGPRGPTSGASPSPRDCA